MILECDSGRMLKMDVRLGRRRSKTGGVPLRSVEDIVEPGTKFELGGGE
jgi:hypothetical protein